MAQIVYGSVARVDLGPTRRTRTTGIGLQIPDALLHMTGIGKGSIGRQGELLLKIDPRD
jgi:hypothetical protein